MIGLQLGLAIPTRRHFMMGRLEFGSDMEIHATPRSSYQEFLTGAAVESEHSWHWKCSHCLRQCTAPAWFTFLRSKEMTRRKTTTAKVHPWNQPIAVDLVEELRRLQVGVVPAWRRKKKTTKIRSVGYYYDNYHVPCLFRKKNSASAIGSYDWRSNSTPIYMIY